MILVSASDCLQHKFGSNCLNGGNLNVGTVEVQLDSIADTKLLALRTIDCKTVVFFSKSVKNSVKRGVRVLRARSASLTRVFSVSPQSRSLFSALFENLSPQEQFAPRAEQRLEIAQRNCTAMLSQIREELNTPTDNEQLLRLKRMSKSPHSKPRRGDLAL